MRAIVHEAHVTIPAIFSSIWRSWLMPRTVFAPAPAYGQHAPEVLGRLCYSEDKVCGYTDPRVVAEHSPAMSTPGRCAAAVMLTCIKEEGCHRSWTGGTLLALSVGQCA